MNKRRRMTGFVVSDKMMKTVVVNVTRTYQHPLYKKVVHASSRFKAHDELGAKVGDEVVIVESRPISRHKHWVVESIVRRQEDSVELIEAVNKAIDPGAIVPELVEIESAEAETVEPVAEAVEVEPAEVESAESETDSVETDAAEADTNATEPAEGE